MKRVVLINIILIIIILVASFFSYFYFVKRDLTEVVFSLLPTAVAEKKASFITALYGEGKGELKRPTGIALTGDGKIYVSDSAGFRIVVSDLNGHYLGNFGSYGEQVGQFKFPYGITVLDSKIYVADPMLNRISVFDNKGKFIKTIISPEEKKPYGFAALTNDGQKLYATDVRNQQIIVLDTEGQVLFKFGENGEKPGSFSFPNGIAVKSGKIYVADSNNNRIEIFTDKGLYQEVWLGTGKQGDSIFSHPRGIAFDQYGNLLVVNMMGSKIMRVNKSGIVDYQWGGQGSGNDDLNMPLSLAIDQSTGKVYVGDNLNNRISIFMMK